MVRAKCEGYNIFVQTAHLRESELNLGDNHLVYVRGWEGRRVREECSERERSTREDARVSIEHTCNDKG